MLAQSLQLKQRRAYRRVNGCLLRVLCLPQTITPTLLSLDLGPYFNEARFQDTEEHPYSRGTLRSQLRVPAKSPIFYVAPSDVL